MIRSTARLLTAGVAGAMAFYASGTARGDAARTPVRVNVAVTNCGQEAVSISINPWQAHVRAGDDLAWVHSGVDSVTISPGQDWPFPNSNPRAARGRDASAGTLAQGRAAVGSRFSYAIVLHCGSRMIRIDPDIVIDE